MGLPEKCGSGSRRGGARALARERSRWQGAAASIHWKLASDRYADRPMPLGTRLFGLGGTALVCLAIVGAALFKWQNSYHAPMTTTLSVFDVADPEVPPAPDTEFPPEPEQVLVEERPKVEQVEPRQPVVQMPSTRTMSAPVVEPVVDPGPPVEQASEPEASPLPSGPKPSDAKPTWEGQVLAALNRAKRYPREASFRREQGVPWIRFVMDRDGNVMSSRLERSSGIRALDREAVALPKRAAPLPKPPEDLPGGTVELVVPVEFFMATR